MVNHLEKLQKKRSNIKKKYVRDKRSPKPRDERVSQVMSANKRRETGPEVLLRKELWKQGLRGYRKDWSKVPGRPDVAFVKYKLAIFIHGCYWHRCPRCSYKLPKTNKNFWRKKFEKNRERDSRKVAELKKLDWRVLVVWEHEIKKEPEKIVNKIKQILYT